MPKLALLADKEMFDLNRECLGPNSVPSDLRSLAVHQHSLQQNHIRAGLQIARPEFSILPKQDPLATRYRHIIYGQALVVNLLLIYGSFVLKALVNA